jgi:hypothetical protein
MMAKLKKLEASDGNTDFETPPVKEKSAETILNEMLRRRQLQMMSVPKDGWLGGSGRKMNVA